MLYMKNICNIDSSILDDYVDNTLNRAEKLLVEAHIKSCPSCRKYVSELKLLFWELDLAAKEPVDIPDDIRLLGIELCKSLENRNSIKKNSMGKVIDTSAGVIRNSFSFTKYIIPSAKTGMIRSYAYKLKNKAVSSGRRYLRKQISGLLGGST